LSFACHKLYSFWLLHTNLENRYDLTTLPLVFGAHSFNYENVCNNIYHFSRLKYLSDIATALNLSFVCPCNDVALWKYYSVIRKFKAACNKCIKKLFGYARCDSMSGILIELGLPTADTVVHNSHVLFASHCLLSCNG